MGINLQSKVCGFYKLTAVKIIDGVEIKRSLTDWFPNLITNGGLDRMATSTTSFDYMKFCQVGTSSAVPLVGDTALGTYIAGTSTIQGQNNTVNSASPYYISYIKTYRFDEGVAAGNLSEVGIGWATSGSLFSRALIVDGLGNPTTITVLSDEYLDVTYEYRFYPKETDTVGTIVATGNIGGTYNYTLRPAVITDLISQLNVSFVSYPTTMANKRGATGNPGPDYLAVYAGDIGSIFTIPTGVTENLSYLEVADSAYINGTYTLELTITLGLPKGNIVGGIKSVLFTWGPRHYQIAFDNPIPKTSEDIVSFTFTHSWGRM